MLKEAADFTSDEKDLETYCLLKIAKTNKLQLNLTEDKIVDFVTYGISDENIRRTVCAARYKNIASLKKCLSIFNAPYKKTKD